MSSIQYQHQQSYSSVTDDHREGAVIHQWLHLLHSHRCMRATALHDWTAYTAAPANPRSSEASHLPLSLIIHSTAVSNRTSPYRNESLLDYEASSIGLDADGSIAVISPYRFESILDYVISSIRQGADGITIHSSPYRWESIIATVNPVL